MPANININGKTISLSDAGYSRGGQKKMRAQLYVKGIGTVYLATYALEGTQTTQHTPPPFPTPTPDVREQNDRADMEVNTMTPNAMALLVAVLDKINDRIENIDSKVSAKKRK